MEKQYGEVKTRKNFYPQDARNIIDKGSVRILLVQAHMSERTKKILKEGNITAYEGIEPEEIEKILEVCEHEREMEKE